MKKQIANAIFPAGCIILLFLVSFPPASARTLYVGPEFPLKTPKEAIRIAKDGDVIKIAAGIYENDSAEIRQNNLTLESIGGYAHLKNTYPIPNGKAIWVVKGQNITLRRIEFSGARVQDKNGAGIRLEAGSLTVLDCNFHDNEMGLITSNSAPVRLHIRNSEFSHNRQNYPLTGKLSHNIYVGSIAEFIMEHSISRGAMYGHNVKSRAKKTTLTHNRIFDEGEISSSYLIDIPNGGLTLIENNDLYKNKGTQNNAFISYGAEGIMHPENTLTIRNNSGANEEGMIFLLKNHSDRKAIITENSIENIMGNEIPGLTKDGFLDRMKHKIHKHMN